MACADPWHTSPPATAPEPTAETSYYWGDEQQREIVSNERDWNLIAQELHCENTREEMLKSVRERDLTIQGFREAAQEALVVIAALLNAVDWELSPAVIEALRGADEKLMTALANASSAKEGE